MKQKGSEYMKKTLVICSSQTGFTRKYAHWLAEATGADLLEQKEAAKKEDSFFEAYQAIVYGGWVMAGKVMKSDWFLGKAQSWKDKRLAIFAVGASPMESPDIEKALQQLLTEEQKQYIRAFYCPGGLNYDAMKLPSRLAMKMLASVKGRKNATEDEKKMAAMISSSYDLSDRKYLEPVAAYLG